MVDAGAEVDGVDHPQEQTLHLSSPLQTHRSSPKNMVHQATSKGQEGLGRILVEDGLCFVERSVRSDCRVEGGQSSVVELVGDEGLDLEDQGGTEAVARTATALLSMIWVTHSTLW